MSKKRIGIIGGAGPYASTLLLKQIVSLCYEEKVGEVPDIRLINFPFTRGLHVVEYNQHQAILQEEVQCCLDALKRQDVELFVIVCNTLHHFVQKANCYDMQMVHIPQLVIDEVEGKKMRKVLVLATQTSLELGLYHSEKVDLLKPSPEELSIVSTIIDKILEGKIELDDSLRLRRLIEEHRKKQSFDGVILGCTELPVLFNAYPFSVAGVTIFDSINIPANKLISEVI